MSDENGEYGVKKLKVEVGRSMEVEQLRQEKDAEIESLKTELDEKSAVLAQKALTEFEIHKQKLSERFGDPTILDLGTPSEVADYIANTSPKEPEKRAPFGKSPFYPPTNGEQYPNSAAMVDELYKRAYYQPELTAEEKSQARAKINQLWHSFETGKSLSQIRESGIDAIAKPVSDCPSCYRTIQPLSKNNPTCPFCGYDIREKQANRKGTGVRAHEGSKIGQPPT
jgi:ssDNA-binding Zn-finger/Zn-ribbon topoisomerase 1